MRRTRIISAVTAALLLGAAPAATAAPPDQEMFTLTCDDGGTYDVVVNGGGTFTPGRVVDGGVFVPTALGDFTFEAVLPSGEVVTESMAGFDEKGGGNVEMRSPRPLLTCMFSASFVLDEEQDGFPAGTQLSISGTVRGFLVGRG